MTSLSVIRLHVASPASSSSPSISGSSSPTIRSQSISLDGNEDDDDVDESERYEDDQSSRYLDVPSLHNGRDANTSQTTLRASTTNLSTKTCTSSSAPSIRSVGHHLPTSPGQAFPSTKSHRISSIFRGTGSNRSSRRPSVNGIDQGLKLSFLSTLGPGIPVTPTASVFGDNLNGFIDRDPQNPGGLFGYSPEEEKRLVRKIDWRLIPILGLFYGASTLNRINLTNARMFAFEISLHATAEEFSWAIAVFFCGFGLAEIPSIMALLYLTPKVWLPTSMFIWGCITFAMAWVKIFPLLLVLRFLLGIAEAALIPGVLIYISMFYKRSEQTFRMALLQTFSSAAGVLGGLISGITGRLDGRIRNDTKVKVNRRITKPDIIAALKDPKVYIFMAMNLFLTVPLISSNGVLSRAWMAIGKSLKDGDGPLFPPNITSPDEPLSITGASMGFLKPAVETLMQEPTSAARILAQLLSSPAYLVGAMSAFGAAILADRTQQRGTIMMGLAVVTIAGYCMELFTLNVYVNYVGVLVINMGQTPITPIVTSWLTTNVGGYAKRAIAVAMFLLSQSAAGVLGSQLYKSKDGPRYMRGHLINIACMVLLIIFAALQRFMLKRENNRRNYSVSFGVNPLKAFSKSELRDINDSHPAFRYTL
ncbi:hypothetical protein BGZ70_010300 [Mortierella alpina]|uniref:Major facilitator superfamily (MFS) profile domain-containing protein n=1 Tax=Mortierella alpina TaxID=64518 RepID=A0A9P6LZV9_MORAP|nr:hypothetical protein BGZ70_010300 [Mortierella alpina]